VLCGAYVAAGGCESVAGSCTGACAGGGSCGGSHTDSGDLALELTQILGQPCKFQVPCQRGAAHQRAGARARLRRRARARAVCGAARRWHAERPRRALSAAACVCCQLARPCRLVQANCETPKIFSSSRRPKTEQDTHTGGRLSSRYQTYIHMCIPPHTALSRFLRPPAAAAPAQPPSLLEVAHPLFLAHVRAFTVLSCH
jgi:hypothetical protein